MAEPQISVSRETLRAELGEVKLAFTEALASLELRLLDRLADKTTVEALAARLDSLAAIALVKGGDEYDDLKDHEVRLSKLEGWRIWLSGAAGLAVLLAGSATLVALKFL